MHTTKSLLRYCIPPISSQALITLLLSPHCVLLCPETLPMAAALVVVLKAAGWTPCLIEKIVVIRYWFGFKAWEDP